MINFDTKADISDLLTLATLLVTIYFTWQTSKEFQKREKQELCLSLLERWNSEKLRQQRSIAWDYLHSKSLPESEEIIFCGDISYANEPEKREIYDALIQVSHFFSDLRALWFQNLLDDKLTITLFGHSIEVWLQFLNRLDSRMDKEDGNSRFRRANSWRANNVLPLERLYGKRLKKLQRSES